MTHGTQDMPGRRAVPTAPGGSWSITGRLTVLYTVSTCGLLILSSTFLYWVLANNLTQESNRFLLDKISVLRGILWERPADRAILEGEVQSEVTAHQYTRYYVRVLDVNGWPLIETPRMAAVLPTSVFPAPPDGEVEKLRAGVKWQAAAGKSYYLTAAWAAVGDSSNTRRLLQVGLDVSQKDRLLADYRRKLAIVLGLGLVCSTGTAIVVARKGMRPLAEITQAARHITATQLHERIGPVCWPKELTALATTFDEMLIRLEDSFTRLARFSADLAHELRTPINNLMGETEVALSRLRTPAEYQQVLGSSLEEYARLARLIDSLLFLARAESPQTRIERAPLEVHKELEAVREFYDAVAEERGVEVSCQGHARIYADPILFPRAISNLLSNALQHTPRGGKIILSVRAPDAHSVVASVSDTGSGIAPEHLPKVFDRFYRVDPSRSQCQPGMGLGLAIVKSIMDLHGGTVAVQSEPHTGTIVSLRFPTLT
jgi:two-component system heavy metal sensor histidine kinase CusS